MAGLFQNCLKCTRPMVADGAQDRPICSECAGSGGEATSMPQQIAARQYPTREAVMRNLRTASADTADLSGLHFPSGLIRL